MLRDLDRLIADASPNCGTAELRRWVEGALALAVEKENETVQKALSTIAQMKHIKRESMSRNPRIAIALAKLRVQVQTRYRPGLEKALREAAHAGVDHNSPEVLTASKLLSELMGVERKTRGAVRRRLEKLEVAQRMLQEVLEMNVMGKCLDGTLQALLLLGVPEQDPLVRDARRLQVKYEVQQTSENVSEEELASQDYSNRLLKAVGCGKELAVKALLKYKADPNATDEQEGCCALALAAAGEDLSCFTALLSAGAKPDRKDSKGRTPMMLCVGHEEGVRFMGLLLQADADINVSDEAGRTALHVAVVEREVKATRFLLDEGGDTEALDDEDKTPFHRAREIPPGSPGRRQLIAMFKGGLEEDDGVEEGAEEQWTLDVEEIVVDEIVDEVVEEEIVEVEVKGRVQPPASAAR